jgi:hypothetical protein
MEQIVCPAECGRFFLTAQGRENHLTQSHTCSWYRIAQESKKPGEPDGMKVNMDETIEVDDYQVEQYRAQLEEEERIAGDLLQEYEEENDIFHFVPLIEPEPQVPEVGEAGPGPSTQSKRLLEKQLGAKLRTLDDSSGESAQIFEWNEGAGAVIRMDSSIHDRWKIAHNIQEGDSENIMDSTSPLPSEMYAPFASEMDWKVAEWAVKEGIGHNSFDRFLAIPGVSYTTIVVP